jgi:hypothetical protein
MGTGVTPLAGDAVMELSCIWYGESQALVESLRRIQSADKNAKIVRGHRGNPHAGEAAERHKLHRKREEVGRRVSQVGEDGQRFGY